MLTLNKKFFLLFFIVFTFSFIQNTHATILDQSVIDVVDTNPDPTIFEANLTTDEQDVNIDGTTVHTIIYKDDNRVGGYAAIEPNGIPVPQIVVNVGDLVIVTLSNQLAPDCAAIACNTSIHWHGLELDNDSDGTGVTQNRLSNGETYTYRFIAPRPGVFWFHPHMKPGPQTFAGTYGAFIVKDPNESTLQADGKLPSEANTHTLVLSDIEFDPDGDVGYGTTDAIPWATKQAACAGGVGCSSIKDAETVLVNGINPQASTPVIKAKSGSGIRLRLANVSTNRYFRLSVSNNGADNNLYRVGGEGGILENARLEGGMYGTWDSEYDKGEIYVSASQRADAVIVPTGNTGDIITISNEEIVRGGPIGTAAATGDLLHIEIDNSLTDTAYSISDNAVLLGPAGISDLKSEVINDFYIPPVPVGSNPGNGKGMTNQTIILDGLVSSGSSGQLGINYVQGHLDDSGPDYLQVPFQDSSRYAKTGDLLEFTISNFTRQHHPFHHHGFSFQPVRIIHNGADNADTSDDSVLYDFDYNEFVDVIDIPNDHSIVVRMSLDDRPRITDTRQEVTAPAPNQFFASGGAAGRWVFHCHLFLHASIGMISELVVVDTDRDGDGFDTSMDCNDFDNTVFPGAMEICDDGLDNDCNGKIDDCNLPPTADAGDNQVSECSSPSGTQFVLDGTGSSDPDGDDLTYLWEALGITFDDPTSATPSATFPLGTTTVKLTVSDGEFEDSDEMTAETVDTTDPVVSVTLNTDTLWTPNHKLVDIEATVTVTDTCDADPSFVLTSITSSEFNNATGDGNTTDDIAGHDLGTPDTEFQVRAERDGKQDGRTYTITYTGSDESDNTADETALVIVPHNQ